MNNTTANIAPSAPSRPAPIWITLNKEESRKYAHVYHLDLVPSGKLEIFANNRNQAASKARKAGFNFNGVCLYG